MFSIRIIAGVFYALLWIGSLNSNPLKSQQLQILAIHNKDSPYPYWLCLPENYKSDSIKYWPVILFLHGRSLSGTDLNLVTKYGLIAEIRKGRTFPAIIIAPQVRRGSSWNPDSVMACLKTVKTNYNVDTNRIAITGMSLGGYGTLHTAGKYPKVFCAAAAFCGGGKSRDGCNLSTIPVWIAHGKKDEAVPFSESVKMANAIKRCNPENLLFTEFESLNHGALERMFRTEELYQFLLGNTKKNATFFPVFKKRTL